MSDEKLQQAITLIHAGDTAAAQKLLAELLTDDPRSEQGWLWLAAAAPPDKRRYCLEKVLSINPDNTQARQMLWPATVPSFTPTAASATPSQPAPQPPSEPSRPLQPEPDRVVPGPAILAPEGTTESAAQVAQALEVIPPLYWTVPVGKLVRIIILGPARLFNIKVQPAKVPVVLNQFNHGTLTKEWFEKNVAGGIYYVSVPLERILRVRLLSNAIRFDYRAENGKDETMEFNCSKDENADSILAALHKRLGARFTRVSRPTSPWSLAGGAVLLLLFVIVMTTLFYQGALDPSTNPVHGRGSGISALLQLLGPNGVLCLGGGIIILMIIGMIGMFINPPSETLLIRKP
jgi:hypothetical protein